MRIIIIVLDSLGVGALPDAADYSDSGTNTLQHCAQTVGGLALPNMEKLGLGHIGNFPGIKKISQPTGSFGKMAEASVGKDTMTGHWEIAGLVQDTSFPLYPDGFPPEVIQVFSQAIGKGGVLCNKPASGTDIIQDLAREHLETGWPIVYTSADSVFQIAAHEKVTPLKELYEMCKTARKILDGKHRLGRVIARPFGGEIGDIHRIPGRQDFSVSPPGATLLNKLQDAGYKTLGIGKIGDIFAGSGLNKIIHTHGNPEGIESTVKALKSSEADFIMVNLVDFDTLYGHRNDARGYAQALVEFDEHLPDIISAMKTDDILAITADHGCDPTTPGTDHTREHVPLLIFGQTLKTGIDLGTRRSFADLGQTIADAMKIEKLPNGISFWKSLQK